MRLFDLSFGELEGLLSSWGEPPYRARQVWGWLWERLAESFAEMSDLPLPLRRRLSESCAIESAVPRALQCDSDEGTEKALLTLTDGEAVEAVLMREGDRRTVCVSTQVGCPVGCTFCATGQAGYVRNLSAGEIAAQVLHFARRLSRQEDRVTHVVLMGMGEPMLNYEATVKAVRNLNDPRGFGLGARRFTVSTVGVVPGIRRLASEGLELNLAISLHASSDELRRALFPGTEHWSIEQVLAAADHYSGATGRRVSYEYVALAGVNDSRWQAQALAELLGGRLAHVNLIPFNPAPGLPYTRPSESRVESFRRILLEGGVDVTVRRSRGVRISAGCGQLRTAQ
ncbi:MAG: 23S rRNA (adenine(2503)-C(2))-methyltransferase RlmN [Candidatus Bipolaricaulota bacterium]